MNSSHRPNRLNRLFTKVVIFLVCFQLVAPGVAFGQVVSAPALEAIESTSLATDINQWFTDTANELADELEEAITVELWNSIKLTAALTMRNAMVSLARTAAIESLKAMQGKGDPMFYSKTWAKFQKDIVDNTTGKFLDSLRGSVWDSLGFDICDPDVSLKMQITLGLDIPDDQEQEKPLCTFTKIKGNYEALGASLAEKYRSYESLYKDDPNKLAAFMTGKMLESGWEVATSRETADIGIALTVEGQLNKTKAELLSAEKEQRREGQGMKAKTSISGKDITTPAWLRRGYIMNEVSAIQEAEKTELGPAMHVMSDIPAAVLSAFLTTFVSQGLKVATQKLLDFGIKSEADEYVPPQGAAFGYLSQQKRDDRIERSFANSTVQKVSVNYNPKEINLLSDFVSCPKNATMFNCVMDHNFAQAVRMATQREPLTVAQAIEQEYINGNKPIIHKNDARNSTDTCYELGFCYSNLVKLRTSRVIPIGWEIAATLNETSGGNVSLNTVIDGFNISGSPYEGLINPNWILKYPKAKCEIEGYGEELLAPGTNARNSYCADVKTCIKESDNGECESWGYCAAEKNSWKFGGNECFASFDSCKSLKIRGGGTEGYVYKTVDNRMCDGANAGCSWYALAMSKVTDQWNWLDDENSDYSHDNISNSIIRLNKNVEAQSCSRTDEGCTEVVRTKVDYGSNQAPNSSFEEYVGAMDDANLAAGINCGGSNCFLVDDAMSGTAAVSFASSGVLNGPKIGNVYKKNKRYFVVSAFIKKESDSSTVAIDLYSPHVSAAKPTLYTTTDFSSYSSDEVVAGSWDRIYSIIETVPNNIQNSDLTFLRENRIWIQPIFTVTGGAKIDDIMVEEISFPAEGLTHSYVPYGADSTLNNINYVQKAPSYIGCYDTSYNSASIYGTPYDSSVVLASTAATNQDQGPFPRGCENFAEICTAKEVGCDEYRPTDGGSEVYGIASAQDYCPQECAGYKSFKKEETFYEQEEFPIYLITRSAEKCDAQNVGCEEFTNLDELAVGGEGKEYYKQLKHCVKVPENESSCAMYFTWESSEDAGYQLKSHYLKSDSNVTQPATLDAATNAASCNADVFAGKSNPDCLEYYDEDGKASYRLSSQVISCSENCHPYRRTLQYQDYTEFTGTQFVTVLAQSQCEQRKGVWQNNECIFMAIPGEGITCDSDSAGCREYRGNFAGDEQTILETNFSDWEEKSAAFDYVSQEEQKRILRVESRDQGPILVFGGVSQTLSTKPEYTNLVASGFGDYALSFWIKADASSATSDIRVIVTDGTPSGETFDSGVVSVSQSNWEYKTFNFLVQGNISANLTVEIMSIGENTFYIDNYKIAQKNDVNYLIKDSWDIPVTCDNDITLNSTTRDLPRAMVGCREYNDKDGATHYLKGFSSLCDESKVGCEAVIDTKNSQDYQPKSIEIAANTSPVEQAGSVDPDKSYINFGADEWLYLVLNDDSRCPAGSKGCTAVGKPELTVVSNQSVSIEDPNNPGNLLLIPTVSSTVVKEKEGQGIYDEEFYVINPDNLLNSNILCSETEEGCEEFTDKDGSNYYFRNPYDRVCEYRQGTAVSLLGASNTYEGWFIRKSDLDDYEGDIPCETKDYYYDGTDHVVRNDDADYDGYVGICENKADKCTAFLDPTDRENMVGSGASLLKNYGGKAYYYLNDENIDKTSCNSAVDRNIGCVMLSDTSQSSNELGNAYQTYFKVRQENVPQSPLKYNDNNVDTIITEPNCSSPEYTYCRAMEACLAIYEDAGNDMVDLCLDKIKQIDAAPGVSGDQFVCADGGSTAISEDLLETNAKCTARKLLQNDSNLIVKVKKDRVCSSWYGCKSTHWSWDSRANTYVEECDELGLCTELAADGKCAHFVTTPIARNLLSNNEPLTSGDKYKTRNTGWFDLDYSGYAIVDKAPLNYYTAIDVNTKYCYSRETGESTGVACYNNNDCTGTNICRVARFCGGTVGNPICSTDTECNLNKCDDGNYVEPGNSCPNPNNVPYSCGEREDYPCDTKCEYPDENFRLVSYKYTTRSECRALCNNDLDAKCKYIDGRCLMSITGSETLSDSAAVSCRVYPQKESPFPSYIDENTVEGYENVNTITLSSAHRENPAGRDNKDYGCFYTSYRYGSDERFYPNYSDYSPAPDAGFCMNNLDVACTCDLTPEKIPDTDSEYPVIDTDQSCSTKDCGDNGLCAKANKNKVKYTGLSGYCLQYDESTVLYDTSEHPCLIWYPTNNMQGLNNLRDNHEEAGFYIDDEYAGTDDPKFCVEPERWEKRHTYIARTDGSLSCGDYDGLNSNLSLDYDDELAAPRNFYSKDGDQSFTITQNEGNMMNTKVGDWKPNTQYKQSDWNSAYVKWTNGTPWWEFFHGASFEDVYRMYSYSDGYEGALHYNMPNVPSNDYWPEYKDYFNSLIAGTTNLASDPTSYNQKAFDSLTIAKALLRQCGAKNNGDAAIEDPWTGSFGPDYNGPVCPEGYRPGLTTFFDAKSWKLYKGGPFVPGVGDKREIADTIVTHHECIPEYTGVTDANADNSKLSWYFDNGPNFASSALNRDYTANGVHSYSIDTSSGDHIFCEDCVYTTKKQCDDDIDNDGDGKEDFKFSGALYTGDANCESTDDDCEYLSCINDSGTRYATNSLSSDNLCNSDSDCDEEMSCKKPSGLGTKYCYAKIQVEYNSDRQVHTKEYQEPNMIAAKHLITRQGTPSIELYEADAPVCSKYVVIPSSSPIYSDHYYKVRSGGDTGSVGLANCNTFSGGSMDNLIGSNLDAEKASLMSIEESLEYPEACGFLGALPDDSSSLQDTSSFFMYNYLAVGEDNSRESSLQSNRKECQGVVDQGLNLGSKAAYAGGTMCFDISKESSSNVSDWQLKRLFAQSSSVFDHSYDSTSAGDNVGLYAWKYVEDTTSSLPWDNLTKSFNSSAGLGDKVYSPIVMGVAETVNDNDINTAIPNTITVVSGDGASSSGPVEIIGAQADVSLKFYAWADRNAMPIKKVKIDWGDKSDPTGPTGKLKNHKPRCQRQEHEKLGLCLDNGQMIPGYSCSSTSDCDGIIDFTGRPATCSTDTYDNWGDTFESCTDDYFNYSHSYTCASPESLPVCGSVDEDDEVVNENCHVLREGNLWCRYKPRVTVSDNWNWCNQNVVEVYQLGDGLNGNDGECLMRSSDESTGQWYSSYIYVRPESAADQSTQDFF
jgi:hypothetical protein